MGLPVSGANLLIDSDLPMLGVCRGLQVINVALGGSLHQDLGAERPNGIKHDYFPTAGFPRDYLAHEVEVARDTRLEPEPVAPARGAARRA